MPDTNRPYPFLKPWISFLCLFACPIMAGESQCPIQFSDVTRQTGIRFVHTDGSSGRRYIVETVCCGLALLDFDRDGDIDIYFVNGAPLPGSQIDPPPRNALYRNDGGWKFSDVTAIAGVGDTGYGLGVCTGDYDNDGDLDIYVNNFGPNVLYRNNGDGTFTDVTQMAGVAAGNQVGAGASFLDMDGDGDLDLFVANYVGFTFENHRISYMSGFPSYVGPLNYPPTANVLYRNNGDGTFTDVSVASGIAAHLGSGMGMICADYDNDGDTDIIVGNDLSANFVFQNDGTGKFREVGAALGLAYDVLGNVHGTMAVECADWNNDGWLDFYMTAYQRQMATLYQNKKGQFFEDVSRQTGAGSGTYPNVTWGTRMVDLDHDGYRDIFIACGHLIDNVEQFDDTTSYHARNILLRNNGQGRFVNVSDQCGDGLLPKLSSRGAVFDDLDNDGDLDVVILNSRREPTILRNESKSPHHWVQVQLRGGKSNRDGIGARVTVRAGDLTLIDEVHSGRSYQSDSSKRLYFGLGPRQTIEQIQVRWIGGGVDVVKNAGIDRLVTVVEGSTQVPPPEPASKP
ncbi:MAG TPA: CRTAC1 family protein [Candidatus Paceibacterota bacterium]|nr:CRTAC1 family protein [Verrucomicrobiota bacterium]HRY50733.1 CRTAC1 family protein [Candidatus Paceibacterota bacterium]